MKKLFLVALCALMISSCAEKEQYEKAVLAEIKRDQEGGKKKYNIDTERMAKCVVDTSARKMPGFFPLDPTRRAAYRNYAKMLTLTQSKDPKQTLDELRKDFGSPKALSDAHNNFAESMLDCYSAVVYETESEAE
ncbi:MAG: hypothetical protein ACU84H_13750 [Gammaproteobacteria bacterium]